MNVIKTKPSMRQWSTVCRAKGQTIAFVPTMGFLHKGHLSLVRRAKQLGDRVVVSIYVNPTQFGPNEDFKSYPRNMKRDLALLRKEGVDAVFAPKNLYETGDLFRVDPGALQNALCGKSRPGHFQGVCTVVLKLFNIIMPRVAVFGQKDAQQFIILKRMVKELDLPVKMVALPIVRERDGLAMSSRNAYLSPSERAQAPSLRRALLFVQSRHKKGRNSAGAALGSAQRLLEGEADYLEAVDPCTLQPVKRLRKGVLVAGAMRLGKTRLIDNIVLSQDR
ncbi:MAG: pantoate--beta-alanine ligase [Fibrobacterota bacterium]